MVREELRLSGNHGEDRTMAPYVYLAVFMICAGDLTNCVDTDDPSTLKMKFQQLEHCQEYVEAISVTWNSQNASESAQMVGKCKSITPTLDWN